MPTESCQGEDQSKYLLLCDVGLGKIKTVNDSYFNPKVEVKSDSIHVLARNAPDPKGNVRLVQFSGLQMPMGPIIATKSKTGLNYEEFIVTDPKQVIIRYLICLHPKF